MHQKSYGQACPLARALDVVGDRWTMLIIRDLLAGPRRFKELTASLKGIATNLLASRLRFLAKRGLVEETIMPDDPQAKGWQLTDAGQELEEPVVALARWGQQLPTPEAHQHWHPNWDHLSLKTRFQSDKALLLNEKWGYQIGATRYQAEICDKKIRVKSGVAADCDFVVEAEPDRYAFVLQGGSRFSTEISHGTVRIKGSMTAFNRSLSLLGLDHLR